MSSALICSFRLRLMVLAKKPPMAPSSSLRWPGPDHVLGGELVAPVALHPFAQLETDPLAVGVDFPAFRELALHVHAAGVIRVILDVLAQRIRIARVGDLLEFDERIVAGSHRLKGPEAHVVLAVEALRRRRRGDRQRRRSVPAPWRRGRQSRPARPPLRLPPWLPLRKVRRSSDQRLFVELVMFISLVFPCGGRGRRCRVYIGECPARCEGVIRGGHPP